MAGYDYTDFINAISSALESPTNDPASANPFVDDQYNLWLPRAIEAAEQRIYRELDLMGTYISDDSGALTPNSRRFTLPTDVSAFIVVTQISVFNPAGQRNQLLPVSKEYLDAAWPNNASPFTPSVPEVWVPFDQASIFVGPAPDQAYGVEVTGTIRPEPLSSANTTTILSTYLPDLMIYASLLSFLGFQRDFGQMADDQGAQAITWESEYQKGFKSAAVEQFRAKFQSQGWGARLPSPVASPPQS